MNTTPTAAACSGDIRSGVTVRELEVAKALANETPGRDVIEEKESESHVNSRGLRTGLRGNVAGLGVSYPDATRSAKRYVYGA